MSDPQPSSATQTPAPRRRWRRRLLWTAAGLVVVCGTFYAWLSLRGGRTIQRPLVALLPPQTAVAVQIHRLSDLLAAYDASPLARLIASDVQIGALLLSQEEYRDWREARREAEIKTHLSLGRDFLINWAGRDLTLAYIPTPGEERPGLVLITQAKIGFPERLAELVAQLYPGAHLVTEEYRGVPITTWQGKRPRNSLSFCRFGETVALSLRTDSTAYLHAIADAALSPTPPTQPAFPPPTVPGLHAWANAERLPAFLTSLPGSHFQEWLASPDGTSALALLANLEEGRLAYTLNAPREVHLEVHAKPGALPRVEADPAWRQLARRESLGVAHLEKPAQWWTQFSPLVFDFSDHVDPDWSPGRLQRHRARREWRVRLGAWLRDEVLARLDGPATLVVDSVVPQLGFPGVRGALIWESTEPDELGATLRDTLGNPEGTLLSGIEERYRPDWLTKPWRDRSVGTMNFQSWSTPLGVLGWTMWGDRLLVTLDDTGDSFTRGLLSGWSDSISDQRAYRSVQARWGDAATLGQVYLHAFPLTELSPLLLLHPDVWTKSGRRYLEQIRLANHLLALYPAAGLALQQGDDSLSLVLAVAASGEE